MPAKFFYISCCFYLIISLCPIQGPFNFFYIAALEGPRGDKNLAQPRAGPGARPAPVRPPEEKRAASRWRNGRSCPWRPLRTTGNRGKKRHAARRPASPYYGRRRRRKRKAAQVKKAGPPLPTARPLGAGFLSRRRAGGRSDGTLNRPPDERDSRPWPAGSRIRRKAWAAMALSPLPACRAVPAFPLLSHLPAASPPPCRACRPGRSPVVRYGEGIRHTAFHTRHVTHALLRREGGPGALTDAAAAAGRARAVRPHGEGRDRTRPAAGRQAAAPRRAGPGAGAIRKGPRKTGALAATCRVRPSGPTWGRRRD